MNYLPGDIHEEISKFLPDVDVAAFACSHRNPPARAAAIERRLQKEYELDILTTELLAALREESIEAVTRFLRTRGYSVTAGPDPVRHIRAFRRAEHYAAIVNYYRDPQDPTILKSLRFASIGPREDARAFFDRSYTHAFGTARGVEFNHHWFITDYRTPAWWYPVANKSWARNRIV
jgi:hypothetical protein